MKNPMKLFFFTLLLFLTFMPHGNSSELKNLKFYTEVYPPFNFNEGENLKGISVDLINEVFKELKLTGMSVKLIPWARGYLKVQKEKNTCLFTMARTPEREKMFKWVGPIATNSFSLVAYKGRAPNIKEISDIEKNNLSVAVVKDDIGETLLLNKGLNKKNIEAFYGVNAMDKIIKKMMSSDKPMLWSFSENGAKYQMKKKASKAAT